MLLEVATPCELLEPVRKTASDTEKTTGFSTMEENILRSTSGLAQADDG
jgi:hypothetical protein